MKKHNIRLALTIVLVGIFLSLISRLPGVEGYSQDNQTSVNPDSFDDLVIDFELNKTTIGKYNGILGNLTLTNNGINVIGNIEANFSLSNNYLKFTDTYSDSQTVSLLNPEASTTLNIETILNISKIENDNAADVVILFDASGSMQDEIDAVKAEFIDITNRLSASIASLRMGIVVYGWGEYNEYPLSNENNYVELTFDISQVSDLINELYAGGSGVEPWGDAFYLINTWDWREDVPKLAIIIGDEDCDPGNIVGVGYTGSTYNGTQLLNVITSLKEKGVQINSVYTDEIGQVVNQFEWIAAYTGGTCVDLEELLSGEDPITLPDLIEGWTLDLVREYFVELTVTISWTEFDPPDNDQDFSTSVNQTILIDLAAPSITVSKAINDISDDNKELLIYAKVLDLSGIKQVNMYWTFDNLNSPYEPTWHFKIMTYKIGDTYIETLTNLEPGSLVSFYIEASDTLFNTGKTTIFNITIAEIPLEFRTDTEFYFIEDNSSFNFSFNFSDSTKPLYEPYGAIFNDTTGFLWIESMQSLSFDFIVQNYVEIQLVGNEENYSIIQIDALNEDAMFTITISGNASSNAIKIKWDYARIYSESGFLEYDNYQLTLEKQIMLFKVNLEAYYSTSYLTLISPDELVGRIHIFDEEWNKIETIGTFEPYEIEEGWYYLWVEQVIREGEFKIYYGPEQITNPDDYYNPTGLTGISPFFLIIGFIIGLFYIQLNKKRRTKEI